MSGHVPSFPRATARISKAAFFASLRRQPAECRRVLQGVFDESDLHEGLMNSFLPRSSLPVSPYRAIRLRRPAGRSLPLGFPL